MSPVLAIASTALMVERRLLTPADVAHRLAVSRAMVYKLLRIGELPGVYVGRLPRIAEADLDAYLQRQREEAHAGAQR